MGANKASAQTLLRQDYKDDMTLAEACELAVKILSKTMDNTNLTSEKLEFATVSKDAKGAVVHRIWQPEEIDGLLKESGLGKDEDEE